MRASGASETLGSVLCLRDTQHVAGPRVLDRCLDWPDLPSPGREAVTRTPRPQPGYRYDPGTGTYLLPSRPEDSLVAPRPPHAWARQFTDPHEVTWWVHLVRLGVEGESLRGGRLEAVMLRFQNGTHARYLQPVPPDWRECDDLTLWGYCEQATR